MMSLRKSLSETSAPKPAPKFQTFVGPLLEFLVVRYSTLQCDRLKFRATGRFATAAWIAAFAMSNDLRGALERATFANAGDVFAVPFYAEFEILVRIESLRVDVEFCHDLLFSHVGFQVTRIVKIFARVELKVE
jgi:hypothetical protein